jgi:hypothetical protein
VLIFIKVFALNFIVVSSLIDVFVSSSIDPSFMLAIFVKGERECFNNKRVERERDRDVATIVVAIVESMHS